MTVKIVLREESAQSRADAELARRRAAGEPAERWGTTAEDYEEDRCVGCVGDCGVCPSRPIESKIEDEQMHTACGGCTEGPVSDTSDKKLDRNSSESADALVQRLQLADLAAGREPVESAVIREVQRRREEMARAEQRAGRVAVASKEEEP